MDWKLIVLLLSICSMVLEGATVYRRQANTESPEENSDSEEGDDNDDEDVQDDLCPQVSDRAIMAAEYFPDTMSRERALKILKRAVELVEKPPSTSKKPCRRDVDIDIDAKNALHFLTGEPIGSTTDDSSRSSAGHQTEEEFCPDVFVIDNARRVSDQTIKKILQLHSKGYSEKTIQSQYRWFRRQYLPRMREYDRSGGMQPNIYEQIDHYVQRKINESLEAQLAIHDYHIQQWGFDRADELNATFFKGSKNWIDGVKKRANLVSRQVTDTSSRPQRAQRASIEESRLDFADNYRQISHFYPHHRILNVDQSGHKYEISNLRSLTRRGARDHILAIDSINKNTHSYTIQPIVGRDGRLRGRLLICFREPSDRFGVQVAERVRSLEQELGNVVAVASRSGKMSSRLIRQWVDDVLAPEIARLDGDDRDSLSSQDSQSTEIAGPSWASNPPETWTHDQRRIMELRNRTRGSSRQGVLLLIDSWGGHSSDALADDLDERNIFVLKIPKHTTADLQPLDVQVFRQYKIFIKRVMEAAAYEGILRNMTDRYGIMRMHSVIWNQFQAPVYRDMLLWAWRKTDPDFDQDELADSPPPRMTLKIQFGFDRRHRCDVVNCSSRAFTRCAHCGKHLCLKHFLDRKCFHDVTPHDVDYGNSSTTVRPPRRDDDEGSAGAGASAVVTGGAIGAGATAIGSALGASITVAGSSSASSSGSGSDITGSRRASGEKEERIALLDVSNKGTLEEVEIYKPSISYKDLMRDKREYGLPPRC